MKTDKPEWRKDIKNYAQYQKRAKSTKIGISAVIHIITSITTYLPKYNASHKLKLIVTLEKIIFSREKNHVSHLHRLGTLFTTQWCTLVWELWLQFLWGKCWKVKISKIWVYNVKIQVWNCTYILGMARVIL